MYDNAQCTMHNLASGISSARTVDRSSARTRTSLADKARLVPTGRVQFVDWKSYSPQPPLS